jgi:hypothetical protein
MSDGARAGVTRQRRRFADAAQPAAASTNGVGANGGERRVVGVGLQGV